MCVEGGGRFTAGGQSGGFSNDRYGSNRNQQFQGNRMRNYDNHDNRDRSYSKLVQIGFWNVNGWNVNENSENFKVRISCLSYINTDILAVHETHLMGNDEHSVADYSWFGQNRLSIHVNAKKGHFS